jgi:tRNA (cmo5U34)-methyltransferase
MSTHEHAKHGSVFDRDRAAKYDSQLRLSMEGHDAMRHVCAEVLVAALGGQETASLLLVGIGTGIEVKPIAQSAGAGWRFTGVDPSAEMVAVARERLAAEGLLDRTSLHACELGEMARGDLFDGAQMIGVLHHLPGEEARVGLLREIAGRLKPGAPIVVGCRVGNEPLLRAVEKRRLILNGWSAEALDKRMAPLATMKIPASDAEVFGLLAQAGFVEPRFIFGELHFKVWVARYEPSAIGA